MLTYTIPPVCVSLFSKEKRFSTKTFRDISKKLNFFHPDFTVATGVSHGSCLTACGVYRRLGISPDPEVFCRVYHSSLFSFRQHKRSINYMSVISVLLLSAFHEPSVKKAIERKTVTSCVFIHLFAFHTTQCCISSSTQWSIGAILDCCAIPAGSW